MLPSSYYQYTEVARNKTSTFSQPASQYIYHCNYTFEKEERSRTYSRSPKMINAFLVFNGQGQPRLTKFYTQLVQLFPH